MIWIFTIGWLFFNFESSHRELFLTHWNSKTNIIICAQGGITGEPQTHMSQQQQQQKHEISDQEKLKNIEAELVKAMQTKWKSLFNGAELIDSALMKIILKFLFKLINFKDNFFLNLNYLKTLTCHSQLTQLIIRFEVNYEFPQHVSPGCVARSARRSRFNFSNSP